MKMHFLNKAIFICWLSQAMSAIQFQRVEEFQNDRELQTAFPQTFQPVNPRVPILVKEVPSEKLVAQPIKQQVLASKNRDILFLLDETVGSINFPRLIRLTRSLVSSFCGPIKIGSDATRVGAATFDATIKTTIDFNKHFTPASFYSSLKRLRASTFRPAARACIANAIESAVHDIFIKSRGARVGDSRAEGMIVLLTQGCATCNSADLSRVSSLLQNQGITLVVNYITTNDACLKTMSPLAQGSGCVQQFITRTWPQFDASIGIVESQLTCTSSWLTRPSCPGSYIGTDVGVWTTWGRCTVSCGGGWQTRSRKTCSQIGCSDQTEKQQCNTHTCPVCKGEWTAWFNRDNPSGSGDYEDLSSFRKVRKMEVCISPSSIDGRVVGTKVNWNHAGDILSVSPTSGLRCINTNQKHRRLCKDYEVRFCCPKIENRKEIQIVARTFLQTVLSVSGGSKGGGTGIGSKGKPSKEKCSSRDYSDSGNKLRMIGKACKSGRRKRQVLPGDTPITKRDVLFLIDESGSVTKTNFQKFKRLAQAFTSTFCGDIDIGEDKTRVGILTFDSIIHDQLNFADTFSKAEVLTRIGDVSYDLLTQGATCLIDSLQYTREKMFTPARGARMGVPGTEQVLILFTDGCANCKLQNERASLLESIAEKFSQQDVSIIGYLVGDHSSSCVDQMRNLIDGSKCYQGFRAYNWDEVDLFADTVEAAGCSNSWTLSPPCADP